MASRQEIPKIYNLEQIEKVVARKDFQNRLMEEIRDGFRSYSKGEFNACPIQTMGAPPMAPFVSNVENYAAQTCVKSGYVTGASSYVIKVASGGHPHQNSGLMQVYSQATGKLEALLLDEGILTELRTAAAGAVAASMFAPRRIEQIGLLGSGIQARYQLRFLTQVTPCRRVLVSGRTFSKTKDFAAEMSREGWSVEYTDDPDELLRSCDLIVTTTSAREPVLGKNTAGRKKTQHITCIGADAPGKMELDLKLVCEADLLVADCLMQTQERGEYEMAIRDGLVQVDHVKEIGSLVDKKELQRTTLYDERLTIFDSSGVAIQDCIIASMTFDALTKTKEVKQKSKK
jgi:ornithine cyclodeaminase